MKTAPAKKQLCMGGGSVSSVSSSISTQPPKPSLSATVVPRTSPSAVSSTSKGEVTKKKSPPTEQKEVGTLKTVVEKTTCSSGGLSIRSVEKINEGATKTIAESENVFEKPAEGNIATKNNSPGKTHFKKAVTSVSIIDLSSDEDKSLTSKVSSSELKTTSGSSELKNKCNLEKDSTSEVSSTSVIQKVNSTTSEGKKDDNLEEEMNLVMNEILQISKQKTADDNIEKTTKESVDHSSVTSTTSKQQNVSQSQSHHHHPEKEHQPQPSVPHVKQQSTLLQQHKQHTSQSHSPIDHPKHGSPVQQQKHSNEHHLPEQQQKHSPVQKVHSPKHHSPVQQQRQTIQHNSPVQQIKQTVHPNSPVQSQSQSHSLQHNNSPHQPKQSQQSQPLNLQHPKPQQSLNPQQPLNLQEPKSQQPLNLRQSNPQYNSAPKKKTPEPAHQRKQSQQYSHSQHQQQTQPKPVNISVSKWNKGEMSLNSSSPASTNKSNSSWGSSHEVSPSRQRQTEAPIG